MKHITALVLASLLTACGGGDSSSSPAASTDTYFKQGGLTWSSTSVQTYYYAPLGSNVPLDQASGYYCNGTRNGVLDNFNKETGWRLPTLSELRSLYKEMPKPPGWTIGTVWASGNTALDFTTGGTITIAGDPLAGKFYSVCVHM